MKCKNCEADVLDVFKYCHQCGQALQSARDKLPKQAEMSTEIPQTFEQFRRRLSTEREEYPDKQGQIKKKKLETPPEVMINVGIMKLMKGSI